IRVQEAKLINVIRKTIDQKLNYPFKIYLIGLISLKLINDSVALIIASSFLSVSFSRMSISLK
ncbi:unnamed protein product, partial [marine sediment metagenome]